MPLLCRALTGIWRMSIRSFKFLGKEHIGEDDIHSRITRTTTLFTQFLSFLNLFYHPDLVRNGDLGFGSIHLNQPDWLTCIGKIGKDHFRARK
jgi:hypothetical protein